MSPKTDPTKERQALVEAAHDFYRFGWLPGHLGSLSLRGESDSLINADDVHPGRLDGDDLVELSAKQAAADSAIHQAIYDQFDGVRAIFGLHHLGANLCADRDQKRGFIHFHDLSALQSLGVSDDGQGLEANISIIDTDGFDTTAEAVIDALSDVESPHTPCFVLATGGLFVWGESVAGAGRHAEVCAHLFDYAWKRPMHPKKSKSIAGFG